MNIKTKAQLQIEKQFLYNLAQVLEAYPQYTIAQHIVHFTRRKGIIKQELYDWSDPLLLQAIEDYYTELRQTLSYNTQVKANEE